MFRLAINNSSVAALETHGPTSPSEVSIKGQQNADLIARVHQLVNEFRDSHGLAPLTLDPIIRAEASEHSAEMGRHGDGIEYCGFKERLQNIGL